MPGYRFLVLPVHKYKLNVGMIVPNQSKTEIVISNQRDTGSTKTSS